MVATVCENWPGRILRGALEHQVFEEMREAGLARRLVGGADLVPDHVGDDRRAAVRDHHDLQPVGEREVGDVGPAAGAAVALRSRRASARTAGSASATTARFMAWRKAGLLDWSLSPAATWRSGNSRRKSAAEYGSIAARAALSDRRVSGSDCCRRSRARLRLADAIGLGRRRRLVAGRRLGQAGARRLAGEGRRLFVA